MVKSRDQKIMSFLRRQAIDVRAVKSSRIAAAVGIKNTVVSLGHNSRKTNPLQARFGKNPLAICLHAEIDAIRNALNHVSPQDLRKATLYVYRMKHPAGTTAGMQEGMAKPCAGCMRAIESFEFKRVIYTTDQENSWGVLERENNFECEAA